LLRVQCKTGRLRAGAVRFATCSSYGHHMNPGASRRSYTGQIDLFAVYCPETAGVYLIPIGDVPTRSSAMLRVDIARNRQRKRIRLASDYWLGAVHLPGAA
jgi:putative heme iron utilization protein